MNQEEERHVSVLKAEAKMREAATWWVALEDCRVRIRAWLTRHSLRLQMYDRALSQYDRGDPGSWDYDSSAVFCRALRRAVDEAHDMYLSELDNLSTCEEAARGCELAAQIHWEEADGRI